MRFAPRLHYSVQNNIMTLRWSQDDHWQHHGPAAEWTITGCIAALAHIIKQRLSKEVRRYNYPGPGCSETPQIVNGAVAWITSRVVQDWYTQAPFATKKAFSAWLVSVYEFLRAGLKKSGGLITLSYLVGHMLFFFSLRYWQLWQLNFVPALTATACMESARCAALDGSLSF